MLFMGFQNYERKLNRQSNSVFPTETTATYYLPGEPGKPAAGKVLMCTGIGKRSYPWLTFPNRKKSSNELNLTLCRFAELTMV
jgi:hypothetical protein